MCKCIGCENDGTDGQSDEELEYSSDDDEEESYFKIVLRSWLRASFLLFVSPKG